MADSDWYWAENGKQCGPLSESALAQLLHSKRLPPDTPVWKCGLTAWVAAYTVETFGPFLDQAAPPVPSPIGPRQEAQFVYAGFWRRLVACLIDYALLVILTIVFVVVATTYVGATGGKLNWDVGRGVGQLIGVALPWLYFALSESSPRQATPGKLALGIRVLRTDGERLSFGRASGRHFATTLSSLILGVGYLMAGWTARKQALHDLVAECLVVREYAEQPPRVSGDPRVGKTERPDVRSGDEGR